MISKKLIVILAGLVLLTGSILLASPAENLVPAGILGEEVWTTAGPYGGTIMDVALTPGYASDQTLFAATWGSGVFKSTDGGASWSDPSHEFMGIPWVHSLALSPDYDNDSTLFAGTYVGGVFRSTDGGDSWEPVNDGLVAEHVRLAISSNYANDSTLFAATSDHGVFRSVDGGNSWTVINSGLTTSNTLVIAASPNYGSDQTLLLGTDGAGIFRSADSGNTWAAVNSGLTDLNVQSLVISPRYQFDQTVFAGTSGGGAFKSSDGGDSWTAVNTGLDDLFVWSLAVSPSYASDQTLFAGTGVGIFKSSNGGTSWTVASEGLTNLQIRSLAISPDYGIDLTLFVGTVSRVFKSANGADSWEDVSEGLGTSVTALAVSPDYANDNTLFAGLNSGGIYKSTDGGLSWVSASAGYHAGYYYAEAEAIGVSPDYVNDSTLFAGGWRGQIFKSTDGGGSWTESGSGIVGSGITSFAFSADYGTDDTLFVSTFDNGGVFESTDGGDSWADVGTGVTTDRVWQVAISPNYVNDTTLFAVTPDAGVFKTTTGASSWTAVNNGLTNLEAFALALSPDYANDQTLFVGTAGGVFKSTDGGAFWTSANNGSPVLGVWPLIISPNYATDQTLFASGHDLGVYKSTNGGASWSPMNEGLGWLYLQTLALDPNYQAGGEVFAGTQGAGVWQYTDTNVTIRASGEPLDDVWPHAQLWVNGALIQEWDVITSTYQNYAAVAPLTGQDQIDIAYTNDYGERDLHVDYVEAGGTTVQAEGSDVVYDTLSGQRWDGRSLSMRLNEMLWNGSLRFSVGIPPMSEGTPIGLGMRQVLSDTQVNQGVTDNDLIGRPEIAMDGEGAFTVAWIDRRGSDWGGNVFAQRYTNDGTPVEDNVQVNEDLTAGQWDSSIGIDGNGNTIIVWAEGSWYTWGKVYAQRYDIDGNPIGGNFQVSDVEYEWGVIHTDVAMNAAGSSVIVWHDTRDGTAHLYAQRYDANGNPLGSNFQVNDSVAAWPYNPTVIVHNDGSFWVAWHDHRYEDIGGGDIYAQRYDANGDLLGANFQVNDDSGTAEQITPDMAVDGNGNVIIAWRDGRQGNEDIYVQRYHANGDPLGANFKVNDDDTLHRQHAPSVAADDQGNFIVAWWDRRGIYPDVYAQRYDAGGQPVGGNFRLDESTGTTHQYEPAVAMAGDGSVIFSWYDNRNGDLDVYFNKWLSCNPVTGIGANDGDPFQGSLISDDTWAGFNSMWLDWYHDVVSVTFQFDDGPQASYPASRDGDWSNHIAEIISPTIPHTITLNAILADGRRVVGPDWANVYTQTWPLVYVEGDEANLRVFYDPCDGLSPAGNILPPEPTTCEPVTIVGKNDQDLFQGSIILADPWRGFHSMWLDPDSDVVSVTFQIDSYAQVSYPASRYNEWADAVTEIVWPAIPHTITLNAILTDGVRLVQPDWVNTYPEARTLVYIDGDETNLRVFYDPCDGLAPAGNAHLSNLVIYKNGPGVVEPGQQITYTLTYSNVGLTLAADLVITDVLPITIANVSFINSGAQITPTGSVNYAWQVEDLDPGEGGVITITGIINPSLNEDTLIINQAAIGDGGGYVFGTLPVTTTIVIPQPQTTWTVIVYLNGDNNLDPRTDDAFNRMESVANNPNVNIVVLWDRNPDTGGPWDPGTRRYQVQYDANPYDLADYTEEVNTWDDGELNLGDAQTLYWFVSWAQTRYPADHYLLSIINHGGGWSPELPGGLPRRGTWHQGGTGLSWDDTGVSGSPDYLSTYEMGQVLYYLTDEGTNPLDIVFYDACLMSMLEEVYQIKDSVRYFIASENIAWATFPYDSYINSIAADTQPDELAELLVATYIGALPPNYAGTMAAFDTSATSSVVTAVENLAQAMIVEQDNVTVREEIGQAYLAAQKLDYDGNSVINNDTEGYVDLYSFAEQIIPNVSSSAIIARAALVMDELDNSGFILAEGSRSGQWDLENVHGVSIYLPFGEELYVGSQCAITTTNPCVVNDDPSCLKMRDYYTTTVPPQLPQLSFAQDTAWDEFVNGFIDAHYCNPLTALSGLGMYNVAGPGLPSERPVSILDEFRDFFDSGGAVEPDRYIYLPLVIKGH